MSTWYRASDWSNEIHVVEVERSTDCNVWVRGDKRARITNSTRYFCTYSEAVEWLVTIWTHKEGAAERSLDRCRTKLREVLALRNTKRTAAASAQSSAVATLS